MTKLLCNVRQKMKPEVLAVAEKKAKKMLAAMSPQGLPRLRELSRTYLGVLAINERKIV